MDSTKTTAKKTFDKQADLVRRLIEGYSQEKTGDKKATDKPKISVTDLIRLLQFQREMEKERPADLVEVRWIDPK